MARLSVTRAGGLLVLLLAGLSAVMVAGKPGETTGDKVDFDQDDVGGGVEDFQAEEQKFFKEVKTAQMNVERRAQEKKVAEANLKTFHMDDTGLRDAQKNFSHAQGEHEYLQATVENENGTLAESEMELSQATKIAREALRKESLLVNQSKATNESYATVLGNVTRLKEASALAVKHVREVEFADAKKRLAKILANAIQKVKSLETVDPGHDAYEKLRSTISEIKVHKKNNDLSAVEMQKLVLKGKQDAKKVKELRQEVEDAKQEAHDAEKNLKTLLDAREPPKDAEPGKEGRVYQDKARTIREWIAALDLNGAGKRKNMTTAKLVKFRRGRLKQAVEILQEATQAVRSARQNFTVDSKKLEDATRVLDRAKHIYHVKRTAFRAEKVLETDTMKEKVRETNFLLATAKSNLERMKAAKATMETVQKKTDLAAKELQTANAVANAIKHDAPIPPPKLADGHGIELDAPKSELEEVSRELVWDEKADAEKLTNRVVQKIASKAKHEAQAEMEKAVPVRRQQATTKAASTARFAETTASIKSMWVEPSLNHLTVEEPPRFQGVAHLSTVKHRTQEHAALRARTTSRLRGPWKVYATSGIEERARLAKADIALDFKGGSLKNQPDHCWNGKQDAGELGVDCGGTCSRACGFHRVQVVGRSKEEKSQYHPVSMIPNRAARAEGESPLMVAKLTGCDKQGHRCSKATDLNDPNRAKSGN